MKKRIKKILISIAKRNIFLREIMTKIKNKIEKKNYINKFYNKFSVDNKLCIFEAFNGRKYCDSPKAIYLEMLNNKKYNDYKFVWAFIDPEEFSFLEKNERTKVVKYNTYEYKMYYAKAKYWFTPSRLYDYLVPKNNQVYVQFWHGTPLKKLGFDIKTKGKNALNTVKEWSQKYQYDASRYTYMVSPSAFTTEKYITAFNLKAINKDKCIIETGYPRNDALFTFDNKYIDKLKKDLNIPKNKKIILYAPTWRDDQHQSGIGYTYQLGLNFDNFKEKFGEDYIILFRTHYLIASSIDLSKYKGFILDVSNYSDINDLYILSDIILTDYSSVFFDYANLKRPMIFFMYDLDDYKNNMRDFYIDLNELPGPIVTKEDDLYEKLKNIDKYWIEYRKKYEKFNKKFNYLDDANASKRVLEEIIK